MIVPVEFDIRKQRYSLLQILSPVLHGEVIVVRKSLTAVLVLSCTFFIGSAFGQATNPQRGAVAGGTAGAIIGGIIGHQNDETPEGALIGGAVGAIAGGLLGKQQDRINYEAYQFQQQQAQQQAQRQAAEFSRGVSVNDAIAMSQSGVGPSVAINQIQTYGVQQEIGVNEIIAMHQQGVDKLVITAMQQAHLAGVQPVGPVVATTPAYRSVPVAVEQPVVVERPIVVQPRPIVIKRYPSYAPPRPRPHPHHRYRHASPSINFHYRR